MLYETVDGIKLESRHYPKKDFSAMNKKQREAVINLNRQRRKNKNSGSSGNLNVSSISIGDAKKLSDDISTLGVMIFAIATAQKEDSDNVTQATISADTTSTSSKRSDLAGAVGHLFAAAAKKRRNNS